MKADVQGYFSIPQDYDILWHKYDDMHGETARKPQDR